EVGTEPPRPDDSKAASRVLGRATLGAGRGMIWLGRKLGLPSLTGLGAGWVGAAMRVAPRLSEAVLGRQAAALRALLREFREGNTDRALRRALPLGGPDLRQAPPRLSRGRERAGPGRAAPRRRDPATDQAGRPARGGPCVRGRRRDRSGGAALPPGRRPRGGGGPAPADRRGRCRPAR